MWHLLVSHPALADGAREVGVGRGSRRQLSDARRLPRPGRRRRRARLGRGGRVVRRPERQGRRTARPGSGRRDPSYPLARLPYRRCLEPARRGQGKGLARGSSRGPRARRSTACRTRGRDRRLPLLPAPPGRGRPLPRRACDCRKPKPGMLLEAAADLDIDLSRSWMIGDSDVDAEAGRARRVQNDPRRESAVGASPARRRPRRLPGERRRAGRRRRRAARRAEHARVDLDEDLRRRRRPRSDPRSSPATRGSRASRRIRASCGRRA